MRQEKAKPPPRNPRSNSGRPNRNITRSNGSRGPKPAVDGESSESPPLVVQETATPPEPVVAPDRGFGSSHTQQASEQERVEARTDDLLETQLSNSIENRATKRVNDQHNIWCRQNDDVSKEIKALDAEIALHGVQGKYTLHLRQARKEKQRVLEGIEMYLKYTGPSTRNRNTLQARCNSRIYDFADLPRDHPSLACLSAEYWDLFARCQAANTTSKGLEQELNDSENEERFRSELVDQYSKRATRRHKLRGATREEAMTPAEVADEDSSEGLESLVASLCKDSYQKEELLKSLQQARVTQAGLEAELNAIADALLIQCGMLHPRLSEDQAAPQTSEGNGMVDNENSSDNGTEGSRSSGSLTNASSDGPESASHDEDQPVSMLRAPEPQIRMTREEREEHARQEVRKEGNRCQIHQTEKGITLESAAAFTTRIAEAREKLAFCEGDLDDIEAHRREIPGMNSLSRDDRGRARVIYLAQKHHELTEAEDEFRRALRDAQNAGVIINEECQTSNFCGCGDRTYSFGRSGAPLTRLQASDVQHWLDQTTGGEEESAPTPPTWNLEASMDWNRLREPGFGEQVGEGEDREFDIPENEKQQRITCQRELQQRMRQELQDRELQQDSPMVSEGLEPEPAEHGLYFDLVEDNHHFNVAWDSVRHGPARKIPPPTPAEGDLHPMNRDPNISPDIEQPWCWGNINKPLFRFEGPHAPVPGEEAQKSPEKGAGGTGGEPEANGSNIDEQYSNSGSNRPLPHGPSAPLIDYAIDGYDGENMDGIE